jgi:hypothetical protein
VTSLFKHHLDKVPRLIAGYFCHVRLEISVVSEGCPRLYYSHDTKRRTISSLGRINETETTV